MKKSQTLRSQFCKTSYSETRLMAARCQQWLDKGSLVVINEGQSGAELAEGWKMKESKTSKFKKKKIDKNLKT